MKVNAVVIGSGNIGTDLMYKSLRSDVVRPVWMAGIDPDSEGLALARKAGLKTTHKGVDGLLPHIEQDNIRIAFDATSAYAHRENARKLQQHGVIVIDLTPAALGPFCIPPVNLDSHLASGETNINMVTCGGQATIPIVSAISCIQDVSYGEIISTISSRSAGPGTRQNIDEFTRTTALAIELVGHAKKGKAIIILNPADPPLIMRNTIHVLTAEEPDRKAITESVQSMVAEVQRYVPGYQLKNGPVFEDRRVSVFLEVEGNGDYLPSYAGNLDIMTAAALRAGEQIASRYEQDASAVEASGDGNARARGVLS